ncbi:MAG: hypothetical protein WCL51_04210 [Bacteroidota bacterium]
MDVSKQNKLTFRGVDILNVNFNTLGRREGELNININCIPKVFYPSDNKNTFNIIMDVALNDDKTFELTLRAVGYFEIESELTEELRKAFVNSNATAIMFPYVRSFITTLTSNLGNVVGTLVVPTQFFRGELEEFNENRPDESEKFIKD